MSAPSASGSSWFHTLTRRPQATTINVRSLLVKVAAGEVRIPDFQRPLRWKQRDVVELLDGVWRGYPIGSLLFWKRPARAAELKVGAARLQAPALDDAWWVVDGQQRVTALAASLLDLDHGPDARWVAHFDPAQQRFRPGPVQASRERVDVPVRVLGDLRRLGRWLRERTLEDALTESIEDAQGKLLDYEIPAYVVDTDDEQALRGVFARMNSTGARMRADEVFQALLGSHAAGGGGGIDLDALQLRCADDGFGPPPAGRAPESGPRCQWARSEQERVGPPQCQDSCKTGASIKRISPRRLAYGPGRNTAERLASISYDGVLRLVKDAAGRSAAEQLVERLAFVVASGNHDAHLKN